MRDEPPGCDWIVDCSADRGWQPILSVPVVGTALVLLVPAVDTFYQMAQPRPGNCHSEILSLIAIISQLKKEVLR